jgi:predicted kinase
MILAVAGVSASGKSTLATALADVSGLPHLSSDVIRKDLVGLDPHEQAPPSAYAEAMTWRTYGELGRLAAAAGSAIVDATFHQRTQRERFLAGLGSAQGSVVFVECRAPGAVLERRIAARAGDLGRTSDATIAVLGDQLRRADPLDDVAAGDHVIVRTDRSVEAVVAAVAAALDARRVLAGSHEHDVQCRPHAPSETPRSMPIA